MNALVAIRSNATGLLSPSPAQRQSVAVRLQETAAARAGNLSAAPAAAAMGLNESQSAGGATEVAGGELGKEAFLQLLVLQLQNQDPLEPVGNADMLAQLAQFSALEAQTNLNESFDALSSNVDQLNFISAAQLLGKTVTGVDLNGELRTGVVESIQLDGSVVVLTVDGGFMSMAGIVSIEPGQVAGSVMVPESAGSGAGPAGAAAKAPR